MNLSDLLRNSYMLRGSLAKKGYMRWWHSFSGTRTETGEVRTFFIEFFIINPGLKSSRPVWGQHPYSKKHGLKPSYVMIKAGAFPDEHGEGGREFHVFYPVSALQATDNPLIMQVGQRDEEEGIDDYCLYSEDKLKGRVSVTPGEARRRSLMTDAGEMEWELEVRKAVSCHTGIWGGRLAQMLNVLNSYWHGEGIRSFFQGRVVLDGDIYEVTPERSFGYADKHWGRSLGSPRFQFACGQLFSERTGRELRHSVLAVNGFCPRFLCFPLRRRLMLQLTYMGEDFQFFRCKWETKETKKRFVWHILAKNKTAVMKISGSCTKAEMLNLRYETPDGKLPKQPLWAGSGGVGTVRLYRRVQGNREPLDTLKLSGALCLYRSDRQNVQESSKQR